MPKPFVDLTGNGCHAHVSLWARPARDLSSTMPRASSAVAAGLSVPGRRRVALGGCVAALSNPTVNSYKRINAPPTTSGATWSPNSITYTGNNRTHMIRIPGPAASSAMADGAANPYLLQAGILAAGLDGIANKRDPGQRLDIDMYTWATRSKGAKKLPQNLLDALRQFERTRR